MTSSKRFSEMRGEDWSVEYEDGELCKIAIQWHISDHFGLSRDGASGSVSIIVMPEVVRSFGQEIWRVGGFWVWEGLR